MCRFACACGCIAVNLFCAEFLKFDCVCVCVSMNDCVSTCSLCVPPCVSVSLSAHHVDSSDKRRSESTKDKKTEMTAGKRVGVNKQGNRWTTEQEEGWIKGDGDRGEGPEKKEKSKRKQEMVEKHRRKAHWVMRSETERSSKQKENGRAGGNSSLVTDPDGHTSIFCLGQNSAKPLNHRKIAAKPANLQGTEGALAHRGHMMEACMHKTEKAIDTQPRLWHL